MDWPSMVGRQRQVSFYDEKNTFETVVQFLSYPHCNVLSENRQLRVGLFTFDQTFF